MARSDTASTAFARTADATGPTGRPITPCAPSTSSCATTRPEADPGAPIAERHSPTALGAIERKQSRTSSLRAAPERDACEATSARYRARAPPSPSRPRGEYRSTRLPTTQGCRAPSIAGATVATAAA